MGITCVCVKEKERENKTSFLSALDGCFSPVCFLNAVQSLALVCDVPLRVASLSLS